MSNGESAFGLVKNEYRDVKITSLTYVISKVKATSRDAKVPSNVQKHAITILNLLCINKSTLYNPYMHFINENTRSDVALIVIIIFTYKKIKKKLKIDGIMQILLSI